MHVADVIGSMLGPDLPIRVLGYDGSKAGPDTAETTLGIVSPRALARLATAPGSLGLARAWSEERARQWWLDHSPRPHEQAGDGTEISDLWGSSTPARQPW